MKKLAFAFLVAYTLPLHAADLYCEGQAWAAAVPGPFADSRVVSLDQKNLQLSVSTLTGGASGQVKSGEKEYYGLVYSPTKSYLINLNRFTGEFVLMIADDSGLPTSQEFSGKCRKQAPQF